jgi:two-component system sensor histidine kinase KdpD
VDEPALRADQHRHGLLLAVSLIAARYGRGPAVASSILAVAAFDFFFVPPQLTFAVSDIHT